MATAITTNNPNKLREMLQSARTRATSLRVKSDEMGKKVQGAAVAAITGAAIGAMHAYDPEGDGELIAGVPTSLAVGVVGHAIGAFGGGDIWSDVGNGGLAVWGYEFGLSKAKAFKDSEDSSSEPAPSGEGRERKRRL